MEATLQALNDLERAGVVRRYAIGGAMGATFYVEPVLTFDLDVFVVLPQTSAGLPRTCAIMNPMGALRPEVARLLAAKEDRRRTLARLPFPDKVRVVVRLQRMVSPVLRARGRQVRAWENEESP